MSLDESPWNDIHHCYSFIPSLSEIPSCLEALVSHNPMHPLQTPILVHEVLSKVIWGALLQPCLLTFLLSLGLLTMFILGFPVLLLRSCFTPIFLNNFMMSLLGHIMKCLVLI